LEAFFQRVAASRRMALGAELAPSLAWRKWAVGGNDPHAIAGIPEKALLEGHAGETARLVDTA